MISPSKWFQHKWELFRSGYKPTVRSGVYSVPRTYNASIYPSVRNQQSLVTSVYSRIAVDCSQINVIHAETDINGKYISTIDSTLNDCFSVAANKNQSGRAFIRDVVLTLLEEGCVAIVPTKTMINPITYGISGYNITELKAGKVTEWYNDYVTVNLYNDETGSREDATVPKSITAIIENPFYAMMNEPNTTLQRLMYKMSLLDKADEDITSGKLDIIMQLPYTLRSKARKQQAEDRIKAVEEQLAGRKYGIAYVDATERIIQLNRPAENNFTDQIDKLTGQFYTQLGVSERILDGTADENELQNYFTNIIEPIMTAIVDAMNWKFITKTSRTQGKRIIFLRNPFNMIPPAKIGELSDQLTRNEILSSNEVRKLIGFQPADDPRADELRNKNLNQDSETEPVVAPLDKNQNGRRK